MFHDGGRGFTFESAFKKKIRAKPELVFISKAGKYLSFCDEVPSCGDSLLLPTRKDMMGSRDIYQSTVSLACLCCLQIKENVMFKGRINLLGVRFHPTGTAPEMSCNDLDGPKLGRGLNHLNWRCFKVPDFDCLNWFLCAV